MKRLIIEIPEAGDQTTLFDVVDEAGRRCDGLAFDEMLGQIVMLTIGAVHPSRIGQGYAMHTPDEWAGQREERENKRHAPVALTVVDGGRAE